MQNRPMDTPPSALPPNRSMPPHGVIPVLPYGDVTSAAAWLCDAFGFRVRLRIGDHRIQLDTGHGAVVLTQGDAPLGDGGRVSVMVRVVDVDAHHRQALRHHAAINAEPVTYPYGERQYSARDPGGHAWTFSQTVADVDPADWGGEWGARDAQVQ